MVDQPFLQRAGQTQATGDACHDHREIGGAERPDHGADVIGSGAPPQCVGEFEAVVDELADQAEQAAGAAGRRRDGARAILVGIGRHGRGGGWLLGHGTGLSHKRLGHVKEIFR